MKVSAKKVIESTASKAIERIILEATNIYSTYGKTGRVYQLVPCNYSLKKKLKGYKKNSYFLRNLVKKSCDYIAGCVIDSKEEFITAALFVAALRNPDIIKAIGDHKRVNYKEASTIFPMDEKKKALSDSRNIEADKEDCEQVFNVIYYHLGFETLEGLSVECFVSRLFDQEKNGYKGAGAIFASLISSRDPNMYKYAGKHELILKIKEEAEKKEKRPKINNFSLVAGLRTSNFVLSQESLVKVSDILNLGIDEAPVLLELSQETLEIASAGFGESREQLMKLSEMLKSHHNPNLLSTLMRGNSRAFNNFLLNDLNDIIASVKENMEIMRGNIAKYEEHRGYLEGKHIPELDLILKTLIEKENSLDAIEVAEDGIVVERPRTSMETFQKDVVSQKKYGIQARKTTAAGIMLNEEYMLMVLTNAYLQSDITVNVLIPTLLSEFARMNTDRSLSEVKELQGAVIGTIESFITENRALAIESAKGLAKFGVNEVVLGKIIQLTPSREGLQDQAKESFPSTIVLKELSLAQEPETALSKSKRKISNTPIAQVFRRLSKDRVNT